MKIHARIGFYGDFYQLDLEKAFVENGEEVRTEMEVLIKDLVKKFCWKETFERRNSADSL